MKSYLQTYIKPNAIAVIELSIQASKNEEIMSAHVSVVGQYETLTIPVRVSVAHGSLEMIPSQIVLDDCFPVSPSFLFESEMDRESVI